MKKRVLYYSCLIVGDFVAFLGIAILANLLINKDFSKINIAFILSALVICVLKVLVGILFKTYRLLWMFSIKRNLFKLAIVNISADLVFFLLSISPSVANFTGFTMSIVESAVLMEFAYLIISRFAVSVYLNYFYKSKDKTGKKLVRTLIVGAGNAGAMVLNELGTSNEFGYNIVGFVDDSEDKIGTYISNVKVFGPISDVNNIAIKQGAKKIVIALPSAGFAKMKEITNIIDYKKFDVEILPDKSKLLQDNLKGSIRRVSICDLLGRKPVELDKTKLNDFINNKVVLVTGGGGSIGSEICRQVLDYNPKKLIIFDIYENTTYELKTELDFKYRLKEPKPDYLALIGSVRDLDRLDEIFSTYHPDIIFHAAAHKHVPLVEDSPYEAIKNNIKGTYNVAYMANKYKAQKMVLISTDKAVNPTNVMGASKRFCEMVVEAWNNESKTTDYSMVRFGNVLGSHGSVIPLFKKQILEGGPVTVTSPEITRFFMTIPEACSLVIQSGAYAKGGEKFILDMGEPVKIVDLAKNLIKLSGLELDKDIKIEFTGLRPGEKLYEELLLKTANATKTENEKIFVEYSKNPLSLKKIDEIIEHLVSIGHKNKMILDYLKELEIIKNDNDNEVK